MAKDRVAPGLTVDEGWAPPMPEIANLLDQIPGDTLMPEAAAAAVNAQPSKPKAYVVPIDPLPGAGATAPAPRKTPPPRPVAAPLPPEPDDTPAAAPAAAPLPRPPASAEELQAMRKTAIDLHLNGDARTAEPMYRQILAVSPRDDRIWSNLGSANRTMGRYEAAVVAQKRALQLKPDHAGYWSNLGNVLKDMDRVEEALEAHNKAVSLDPKSAGNYHHRGISYRESCQPEAAIADFERAIRLDPSNHDFRWDRAIMLLQIGRYEEGWTGYEWRYRLPQAPPRRPDIPRWLGEKIPGKRLVIHPEQGFGDTLLATRFLKMVKDRSEAEVVLLTKPPLMPLLQGLAGVDRLHPLEDPIREMDYSASLLDLPRVLRIDESNLPPPPAFNIPEASRAKARQLLAPAKGLFKVGVVWSGSVTFKNNRKRASSVERFIRFGEVPGVQLVSLQKGPREHELDESGANGVMIDAGRRVNDFSETAAVIEELDLVIMTDSSVAHLTGSLGKPIWNLLNFMPYWLYKLKTNRCAWYPSMRLFRQPKPAVWDPVFEEVEAALLEAVRAKSEGRWPSKITAFADDV